MKNIYKFKQTKLINFNFIDRNIEIFNTNIISKFFSTKIIQVNYLNFLNKLYTCLSIYTLYSKSNIYPLKSTSYLLSYKH